MICGCPGAIRIRACIRPARFALSERPADLGHWIGVGRGLAAVGAPCPSFSGTYQPVVSPRSSNTVSAVACMTDRFISGETRMAIRQPSPVQHGCDMVTKCGVLV